VAKKFESFDKTMQKNMADAMRRSFATKPQRNTLRATPLESFVHSTR
jgi:hypothetical protein